MKTFIQKISPLLAGAILASCVTLSPAYALDTESSEGITTQEVVSIESENSAPEETVTSETNPSEIMPTEAIPAETMTPESEPAEPLPTETTPAQTVPTEPPETTPAETVPTEPSETTPAEPTETVPEEIVAPVPSESGDLTEMLSEDATSSIWDMDDLVAVLGAANVSVLTGTRIRIDTNITYAADVVQIVSFRSGTYSIDFNGHTIRGKISFYFQGGSVTLMDSSSGGSGGMISDAVMVTEVTYNALVLLRVEGGSLTISSGTYIAVSCVVRAETGSLDIEGGTYLAVGVSTFTSTTAAVIYAGMSEVRISSGYFYGYRFAILASKDLAGNNTVSISNPLELSGGYFDSDGKAIYYIDYVSNTIPDMDDLLAASCFLDPATIVTANVGPGDYTYAATGETVQVFKSTGVEGFVYRLYHEVLGRTPDYPGYTDWVTRLKNHTISGSTAAYGFFFSPELLGRNLTTQGYISLLYYALFDRTPDTSGLVYWIDASTRGVSRKYVFAGFANSAEWRTLCGTYGIEPGSYASDEPRDQNLQVTSFVNRLYILCLSRLPDVPGLNNWTAALNAHTANGANVALGFFFSPEFEARNLSNELFVEALYRALFNRSSDAGGKANWVSQLTAGMSRREVFRGFANSAEFEAVCASYGITKGTV